MSSENDIRNNVNVNIFGKDSESVHHHHYSISHLHQSVITGDLQLIKTLFNSDNVDTVDQYLVPAIFYAVLCNKIDIVQHLLNLGADTKQMTGFGISVEKLAEKMGISLVFHEP